MPGNQAVGLHPLMRFENAREVPHTINHVARTGIGIGPGVIPSLLLPLFLDLFQLFEFRRTKECSNSWLAGQRLLDAEGEGAGEIIVRALLFGAQGMPGTLEAAPTGIVFAQ